MGMASRSKGIVKIYLLKWGSVEKVAQKKKKSNILTAVDNSFNYLSLKK